MSMINENEINALVESIFNDYDNGKTIDAINIYNKPDKAKVQHLTNQLLKIVFTGYFRD